MTNIQGILPNFFVIGAAKAGTTALYHSLKQHPDIYMSPVKEPFYFAFEGQAPLYAGPRGDMFRQMAVCQPRQYALLFAGAVHERARGEASTIYLRSAGAARRIRQFIPDARLIAILRQPAERAYSDYLFLRFYFGMEAARDFAQALRLEDSRIKAGWNPVFSYKANGHYYSQLRTYFDLFPRERIRVYLYEDWKMSPREVLRDLFHFLEVDENVVPVIVQSNVGQFQRIRALHRMATHPAGLERRLAFLPGRARRRVISTLGALNLKYNVIPPPPLDPDIRRRLTDDYREDIGYLQDLIARDLSHWLRPVV